MSTVFTIAKREFRSYFDSPLAYVVICLSFVGLGAMFFMNFWDIGRASMQRLFEFLPAGLSIVVVPVITMRLMADERASGTLEMLITLPVKDSDVILGKFLGAFSLVLVVIAASVAYPVFMFQFPWSLGPLDSGPVVSGYIGVILYAAAAVSVGLLVSSLTSSQAISFFVTFFVLGALWFSADLADKFMGGASGVLNYICFKSRLSGFMRGLIDSRNVVYFLSITVLSLMFSFRALERRKWA